MAMACAAPAIQAPLVLSQVSASATSSSTSSNTSLCSVPRSSNGISKSFGARLAQNHVGSLRIGFPGAGVRSSRSLPDRKIVASACASEAPLIGNKAPDFEAEAVFDQEFIKVKLSDYLGKKYVVLFFYPLDFTFVCPTEITAFSDRYKEFEKLNTEVLGISVDSVFSHLAWVQTDRKSGGLGDLAYPIVSDISKSIAKSYNVLIPDQGIALRGLFIIDKEGVIQHATINNLAIGRSVDETLRTLQAVQYVQDNPDEVCPAGWKPGDKSMKPDPKLSKEYFQAI